METGARGQGGARTHSMSREPRQPIDGSSDWVVLPPAEVLAVVPGLLDVRIVRSPRRRPFEIPGTLDATFDAINPSHWWLIARTPG